MIHREGLHHKGAAMQFAEKAQDALVNGTAGMEAEHGFIAKAGIQEILVGKQLQ